LETEFRVYDFVIAASITRKKCIIGRVGVNRERSSTAESYQILGIKPKRLGVDSTWVDRRPLPSRVEVYRRLGALPRGSTVL